jgi:hypothetical protein
MERSHERHLSTVYQTGSRLLVSATGRILLNTGEAGKGSGVPETEACTGGLKEAAYRARRAGDAAFANGRADPYPSLAG